MPLIGRREFIWSLAVAPWFTRAFAGSALDLRIRFVQDDDSAARLGARMSLEEAQRAALLLGARVSMIEATLHAGVPEPASEPVIIIAGTPQLLQQVTAQQEARAALILHVGAETAQPCSPTVKHIAPAWDPEADRFGAGQLNARFRAFANRPMDGAAWAGWLAVKIAWESVTRARSTESDAILSYINSPKAGFDGHKGEMLRFSCA